MTKFKLLLLTFLLPFISYSQNAESFPLDENTKLITYREVVQLNGTQDELYIRGIDWINSYYKNPADVCRIRNRESGVIEVLHRIEIVNTKDGGKVPAGTVNYELKLEFKPGRYRYTITDLLLKQSSRFPVERWLNKDDPQYIPEWDDYMQQVDARVKEIIESIKKGMEPENVKEEEKW